MSKDKIRHLHPIDADKDNLVASVEKFRRNMETYLEYQRLIARLQREKYSALIKEGFTHVEALELVKKLF